MPEMQNTADALKRMVLDNLNQFRAAAMEAVSRFERVDWHPRAFEDAITQTGLPFEFDDTLIYADQAPTKAVLTLLDKYFQLIQPYTTKQAAAYLGMSEKRGKKSRLMKTETLQGRLLNPRLRVFDKSELDDYLENRRPVGRPKKQPTP